MLDAERYSLAYLVLFTSYIGLLNKPSCGQQDLNSDLLLLYLWQLSCWILSLGYFNLI